MPMPPGNKAASGSIKQLASNAAWRGEGGQQLLLGVGLAVAIMAFIAVLGVGLVSLTKPVPSVTPNIKSVEDRDGHQVFIIRD